MRLKGMLEQPILVVSQQSSTFRWSPGIILNLVALDCSSVKCTTRDEVNHNLRLGLGLTHACRTSPDRGSGVVQKNSLEIPTSFPQERAEECPGEASRADRDGPVRLRGRRAGDVAALGGRFLKQRVSC